MSSLVPLQPAAPALCKPDLSPALLIRCLQPSRVISQVGPDLRTIWYFEQAPQADRKRTCAYISHAQGSKTFTIAYHPLNRNDQVVADLPMEKLADAVADLIACGFGPQPVKREPKPAVAPQLALE